MAAVERIWREGAWPCFSPDGRSIVFTGDLDRPNNRLMMLSIGGEPRAITPPEINARRPTWLGGTEIAFNRDDEVWTLDLAGGRMEPLLAGATEFFHPCAIPGERAVVVVAMRGSGKGREGVLYKLTEAGATALTDPRDLCAGRPGVSPDGQTIVCAGNAAGFDQGANQLWLVTANAKPRRLEEGDTVLAQGRAPRWSPDGRWIACTSTRPAPHPTEKTAKAVWIIRADGSEAHQITDHSFDPLHVDWSPDQRHLVCGGSRSGLGIIELPERFR